MLAQAGTIIMITWTELIKKMNNQQAVVAWLTATRWFRTKAQRPASAMIVDGALIQEWALCFLQLELSGRLEYYFVPFQITTSRKDESQAAVTTIVHDEQTWFVYDALSTDGFKRWWLNHMHEKAVVTLQRGELCFHPLAKQVVGGETLTGSIVDLKAEQSNTSFIYANQQIVKIYRQLEKELNPEVEMLVALAKRGFAAMPKIQSHVVYQAPGGMTASVAMMQAYIQNQDDGWNWLQHQLTTYASQSDQTTIPGVHFEKFFQLGRLTGQMHEALGQASKQPSMTPVTCQGGELKKLQGQYALQQQRTFEHLTGAKDTIKDKNIREKIAWLVSNQADLQAAAASLNVLAEYGCDLIRYHGDYHLGQCLMTEQGWIIIDFEGEPLRTIHERRQPTCPLKDVAGMLRSFNYAANLVCATHPEQHGLMENWENQARTEFMSGYQQIMTRQRTVRFLPPTTNDMMRVIRTFELEKALYELDYELNNRPAWIHVPLNGIIRLLDNK